MLLFTILSEEAKGMGTIEQSSFIESEEVLDLDDPRIVGEGKSSAGEQK